MSETRGSVEGIAGGGTADATSVNSADAAETARAGLDDVETGDTTGAAAVNEAEREHPEDVEAVEQARSDGPEGRGVER